MAAPSPPPADRPAEQARLRISRLSAAGGTSLPDLFRRVSEVAAECLRVERVGVWFLVDDGAALRCATLYERSRDRHSEGTTLRVADFPEYFHAVSNRGALPYQTAHSDPWVVKLRDAYLKPLNISSLLDAPIFRGGKMIGVVCHEHVGPARDWTAEDRDFAMTVADVLTAKIEGAELEEARAALRIQEERLAEQSRLDALSRLAAGVAHDFKNLLTVVLGNAERIARRDDVPADVREQAAQITAAADRGTALTRELTEFGRVTEAHPKVLDVGDVVAEFLPLLRAAVGDDWPVTFDRTADAGHVLIDAAHLERVVLNLVLNARDAMPGGGPIRIAVAAELTAEADGPRATYVRLEVLDLGCGIPPENHARIFEPSFTTKAPGKGTGLGLAVVRRIVDRAGGFILVDSDVGHGTTFRVYLPQVGG